MRSLALQTWLTDAHVRDWFKQKRINEYVPTIVSEKSAEFTLIHNPFQVKEEPQPHEDDYGFDELNSMVDYASEASENVAVKKEPVVNEDDVSEPDSAVLDPISGKLVKQRRIDKDMETIMTKAQVLESLAKKMELGNKPQNNFREKLTSSAPGHSQASSTQVQHKFQLSESPGALSLLL